jgi:peptidoglycan/LPS O-acetylase OafA/YrhL
MKSENTGKMNNIQYLRALCAISVFLSHVPCLNISNGQIGVSMFLIISGFFAMMSSKKNQSNVFLKKILRIIPLYWALTICVYIFTCVKPDLLYNTSGSINCLIKSLLFIPYNADNVVKHGPLLNVGWYLEIDVFLMLLFSIINKLFYKYRLEITSFILLILFIIGRIFTFENYAVSLYTSYIIIFYIIGLFIYKLYSKKLNIFTEFDKKNYPVIYSTLFFILMYFYNGNIICTILLSIMFVLFLYNKKGKYPKLLVTLGNVSFPFYLIHYFIIALVDRLLFKLDIFNIYSCIIIITIFILTFAISYVVDKILKIIDKKIKLIVKLDNKKFI